MVLQFIPFVKVKYTNPKRLGMFLDSPFGTYLTEVKRTANSCHYSQSPLRAGIQKFFFQEDALQSCGLMLPFNHRKGQLSSYMTLS